MKAVKGYLFYDVGNDRHFILPYREYAFHFSAENNPGIWLPAELWERVRDHIDHTRDCSFWHDSVCICGLSDLLAEMEVEG